MQTMETPRFFKCKKWTIVTLNTLSIIVYTIVCVGLILALAKSNDNSIKNEREMLIAVIVVMALAIVFAIIGLVGTIKENYCIMVTYSVLLVLGLIGNVVNAILHSTYWAQVVWSALITALVISYTRDIRAMHRQQQNRTPY